MRLANFIGFADETSLANAAGYLIYKEIIRDKCQKTVKEKGA